MSYTGGMMATSGSYTQPDEILCAVRKKRVAKTPEELVRQRLLAHMIGKLHFPAGCITVEASLASLPHLALTDSKLPDRRVDVVVFANGIHPDFTLYPLLLIECKAETPSPAALSQLAGYNHHIGAPFIAIASDKAIQTGWFDKTIGHYTYVPYLPTYDQLLRPLKA